MKIAVSAQGNQPSSLMDPRFGRAAGFMIYDSETKSFTFIDNSAGVAAAQGAGIQGAETVANAGSEVVITGQAGPKAEAALNQANIRIVCVEAGKTVEQVVQDFLGGQTVQAAGPAASAPGSGRSGGGRGMGGGGGRGMGGGGGRGMGGGGGRGMGGGGGRGMGGGGGGCRRR